MKCKCKQCGHEWNSHRNNEPKTCAKKGCLTIYWDDDEIHKRRRLKTHGMSKSRIYRIWSGMKQRCNNPKTKGYHNYGGRGIKVCDGWKDSFENFYKDMGEPKFDKATLERVDNDGNYCKENCKWATYKEQLNNRRNNHRVTCNGETKTLAEWSEESGLGWKTIENRIDSGWPIEKSLTAPSGTLHSDFHRILELFGVSKKAGAWAKLSPVKPKVFYKRLNRGWSLTQSIVFPPMPPGKRYSDYIRKINKEQENDNEK